MASSSSVPSRLAFTVFDFDCFVHRRGWHLGFARPEWRTDPAIGDDVFELFPPQRKDAKTEDRIFGGDPNFPLDPDPDIKVGGKYLVFTNYVLTAYLGKKGENMRIDQNRLPLYMPHAYRDENFAALIIPQNSAAALVFANGKIVVTGKTTVEDALLALHLYQIEIGKVVQPVRIRTTAGNDGDDRNALVERRKERKELSFLRSCMGLSNVSIVNIVGSGLLTEGNRIVDLASLSSLPNTNWEPQKFPGLKYKLPEGNDVIPGGHECTAHLFEKRIVIMGAKHAEHIKIAYAYFLKLVKAVIIPESAEYKNDKYSYRHTRLAAVRDARNKTVRKRVRRMLNRNGSDDEEDSERDESTGSFVGNKRKRPKKTAIAVDGVKRRKRS